MFKAVAVRRRSPRFLRSFKSPAFALLRSWLKFLGPEMVHGCLQNSFSQPLPSLQQKPREVVGNHGCSPYRVKPRCLNHRRCDVEVTVSARARISGPGGPRCLGMFWTFGHLAICFCQTFVGKMGGIRQLFEQRRLRISTSASACEGPKCRRLGQVGGGRRAGARGGRRAGARGFGNGGKARAGRKVAEHRYAACLTHRGVGVGVE